VRRGKRVAFMEAELFDSEGRMTARASSTGLMTELIR
jgi:acyl-coenzyme A thioesterase PaaI-like protein